MKVKKNKNGIIKMTAESKEDSLHLLEFLENAAGQGENPERHSLKSRAELVDVSKPIDSLRYFGGDLQKQDVPTANQLLESGWEDTGAGNNSYYQETQNGLVVFYIPQGNGFFIEIGDKEFAPKDLEATTQLLIDLDYQKGQFGAIL